MKNLIITIICISVFLVNRSYSQDTNRITGKISDINGSPIEGAVISSNDTALVQSDHNGRFQLHIHPHVISLNITAQGYKAHKLDNVKGGKYYLVWMDENLKELEEVVVSTGYQKLHKERITGSFERINPFLFDRLVQQNVLERLNGISSGLLYTKTNEGGDVNIRGLSTLTAGTQPLIVLDNFPYEGDIKDINVNIIESITILKDAAAASVWGARSGNGVIVISTKKGRYNEAAKVEAKYNISLQQKPKLLLDKRRLQTIDFIDIERSLFTNGFYDTKLNN